MLVFTKENNILMIDQVLLKNRMADPARLVIQESIITNW